MLSNRCWLCQKNLQQDKELLRKKAMKLPSCSRDEIASYLDIMCICSTVYYDKQRFGPVTCQQSVMQVSEAALYGENHIASPLRTFLLQQSHTDEFV